MRLQTNASNTDATQLAEFCQWLLDVGDGKLGDPNVGIVEITILDSLLIKYFDDSLQAIMEMTYPNLMQLYNNEELLKSRAVLALQLRL
jgi:ATP-dependent DNA helicase PIF1